MCCYQGKISLPALEEPPLDYMKLLTDQDPVANSFRQLIRTYNSALAMTSVGRHLDSTVNDGLGPWTFKLHGELIHQAGSLLPAIDTPPVYSQLYIYDNASALSYRMAHRANELLDPDTLATLQNMLHTKHPGVDLYRQALELTANMPLDQQCRIALRFDQSTDRRRYQPPDASVKEIAVLLPGDGDHPADTQDIILYRKRGPPLQRIRDDHPFYPALRYVLLFPTGQLGWHSKIPYNLLEDEPPVQPDGDQPQPERQSRKYVSMDEFFRYRLHIRPIHIESIHLFLTGNLFQEYVCEAWAVTEQKRLCQLAAKQDDLRADLYQGLVDSVAANADGSVHELGKRIILPSSFVGGTRNMQQHCQDALAINRYFGGGDLFVTMTANPKWPEISDNLLYGQTTSDRPDLVVRVFHAKLRSLIDDIKDGVFGDMAGYLYTIEFQKRGLPHAHIIIFLKPHAKLRTPDQIDSLMSSEFPCFDDQLLALIQQFMVHTPCNRRNSKAPCLVNGTCSKGFPKPFRESTSVSEDSYACTRRSDTGQTYTVKGHQVDNRWVVCHSRYLIWKYRCHINIESIASVKAVKYIYKYVYKGHDRTTMEFGTCENEIKQYLDARYVSSCEAIWRLYFFEMHERQPSVMHLQVHLPDEQTVVYNPNRVFTRQQVLANARKHDTTLMGWFKANAGIGLAGANLEDIRSTLYQDFPSKMVWKTDTHRWQVRSRGFQIGRMYYAHPSSGERFYLRLLLTVVAGATSFEDLRSFQGTLHPSFREACIARGLLEDDNEWHHCLADAGQMQVGGQLRHLFVSILKDCSPADPRGLWDRHWQNICDDLKNRLWHPSAHRILDVEPSEAQIQDYGLYLIDQLLSQYGKRLQDWGSMPQVVGDWAVLTGNPLILEQLEYDAEEQGLLAAECIATLNPDQRSAFDKISSAVANKTGETFFLHGPGGTGKTYLYNTLCYHLRAQGKIVLCVASSGIAALLLKGGRTSHSRFKIPIPCTPSTTCNITKNSDLADLIRKTDLVIWDEAPMQNKLIMQTVDASFQDLRRCGDKPFGGLTIIFGGDFQQILPVVIKGSRPQIVGACMQRSFLWRSFTVLHLRQNMRLNTAVESEANFARWQLEVGQGLHTDDDGNITLPHQFRCRENTIASLIDTIYPDIRTPNLPDQYFSERTILSSKNDTVDALNTAVLEQFPGVVHTFHSADYIGTADQTGRNDPLLNYPVEYLNAIDCSGFPLAKLELKVGCPVMILKNLDPLHGVCNGTRGILTRCRNRVLEVRLLTGQHAGSLVFIPRVYNQPGEDQNAFKFTRKQFPVRLCFAMTINKAQGQSVKHVGLDLRTPVFTHGQLYVGISRVTSVGNIKVITDPDEAVEGRTKNIVYSEVLLR